eukprot:48505-Karenia_brevis.AAC.1
MKKEAKLQAENDQAVLGHKEKPKPVVEDESKEEMKDVEKKFDMPIKPDKGDTKAWAAMDMLI